MVEGATDPLTHSKHQGPPQSMDIHGLIVACQHGKLTVVEDAIRQGGSPNFADHDGCTMLHWAAINNRIDIVQFLVSKGADPNKLGGCLVSSPLHWAARNGLVAMCAILVKAGAVCNVRDLQGYTPIHLAIQGSHVPLVAYFLLKFDYVRDMTDNSGMTPAMWCAFRSFSMFPLRLIVKSGADLSLKEHLSGNTALHLAAQERNYSAVIELLEGSADVSIRNKQQETPLDIARNNKNPKILDAIEAAARKQGAIRSGCLKKTWVPPLTTYTYFAAPLLTIFFIWQIFIQLPLTIAAFLTLGICVFTMVTLRVDFNSPTYRLLPYGVTIAEAVLMTVSWTAYAHWYVPWWAQLLFVISVTTLVFSLIRISLIDPGKVKPSKDCHQMYVHEAESGIQHQDRYCFSCFVRKMKQTKHCAVCDHCVTRFDHHCPWLNSCITRKNQREFILFVISVAFSAAIYCLATGHYALIEIEDHGIESFLENKSFLILTILLSGIHAITLSGLFIVQMNQISMNTTTNEQIKKHREHGHGHDKKGSDHRYMLNEPVPFSTRCHNLLEFFSSSGDNV